MRKWSRQIQMECRVAFDRFRSAQVSAQDCKTVAVFLGPYRNLSTLTASILSLHPNCQVLNHGFPRIAGRKKLDFFADSSPDTFENFLRYAIHISTGGRQGNYGGSILHSHAFQVKKLRAVFEERPRELLKSNIRCLVWKESLRVSRHIRSLAVDVSKLLQDHPRLKFLLPIRNPMDCAVSNLNPAYSSFYGVEPDLQEVLHGVLVEIRWFLELETQHPGRFFHFFEYDAPEKIWTRMSEFLGLSRDPAWLKDAEDAYVIKKKEAHSAEFEQVYRDELAQLFSDHLPWLHALQAFVPCGGDDR